MKEKNDDNFPCRCRGRVGSRRCKKSAVWIIRVGDRKSFLAALRTGWPRLVNGMVEPKYTGRGLCDLHINKWHQDERSNKIRVIYGEKFKSLSVGDKDPDVEAARAEGDKRVEEWSARFKP